MKIIFFGSDKYSQVVLDSLKENKNWQIVKVVSDKASLSEATKLVSPPDVGILASFGEIIPPSILDFPKHGILNIHPSLLPKYRGPTPVPTQILNGEKQIGISIIKMDEIIDHGPLVSQFKLDVFPEDTAESLLIRAFTAGGEALKTILPVYLEDRLKLHEQNHQKATYTKKFSRDDGRIDWTKPADYLERFIRAMFPWPGAWAEIKITRNSQLVTRKLKVIKAHLENKKLVLDSVQLEGKKPVTYKQFCEGYPRVKII